jgi:hypothetical protein
LGAGGEFHPITPVRVLDTRKAELDTEPFGRKPSDSDAASVPFDVEVLDFGEMPDFTDDNEDGYDDNVLAVVASIIIVEPTQSGHLRAFPTGAQEGNTSVLNFRSGDVVANSAVLRPGVDGKISIRIVTGASPGDAHVVVDISGWFSTSDADNPRGARLVPTSPIRAFDSRRPPLNGELVRTGDQIEVPIRGAVDVNLPDEAVPDDENITAVVVNVTGENAYPGSVDTYLSALPERLVPSSEHPDPKPKTSTVNLVPGQVRANLAVVPIGSDGSIHVFNFSGELRVVIDIMGYFVENEPVEEVAGRVIPLVAPFRAFDTRKDEFGDQPLGPGRAEDWSFDSFVADVNIGGVPVGPQSGLFGNLTATNLQRQYSWAPVLSYMTAYPSPGTSEGTPPEVSNLNIPEGESVPNLALLTYGGTEDDPHQVRFYNRAGYVDYLLDVYAVVLAEPEP